MQKLLLKFQIHLEEDDLSTPYPNHGPLFHRWLPDGEKDAIVLDTSDPNAQLKIWFEQWGFKENNGFIKFDYERREVDPNIIPMQAILDAGPLMGSLEIQALSKEKLASLQGNRTGDTHYIDLGKKIVTLIQQPVTRFLEVLRTNYGQYWIRRLEKWDSREMSLGAYCHRLNLKWSLDEGETRAHFEPDKRIAYLGVTLHIDKDFREYLTKDDWQELREASQQRYEPSLSAKLLARSHQFLNQDNLKHAFIEGVSALEIALGEFIRQKLDNNKSLAEDMQSFWQLPLKAQMVTILSVLGTVQLGNVEVTADAIEIRNKVVHEGLEPDEEAKHALSGLLRTAAALLPGPRFRFPSINPGNAMRPLSEWEKQMKKDDRGR